MRIAYEALAWGRHVSGHEHAWRIVRRAAHPALGVCLDSFHILSQGHDPAPIRAIPGEKVFFLQLADAPRLPMDVLPWSRHHRLFPGQGEFDLTAFSGHVLATGYEGPLSLEVFNDVYRQSDPRPAAVDAMRSLLALRESLGVLDLPPAPRLSGHAFAEVVSGAGAGTGAVLASLGFARTGVHRSKPVELWEQGEARCWSTGAGTPVSRSRWRAPTRPAAPKPCSRRSCRVPTGRGRPIAAVAAPDGTELFLCGNDDWRGDFEPTGETAEGAGVFGIDHVALTQPFDHFDEAALFYRSVLGLTPSPVVEFAAPFGLVRSRVVTAGEVRLTLDSAWCGAGSGRPRCPSRSTSPSRARTPSPRPGRCANSARRCWRSRATTTTTSPPGSICPPPGSRGCARTPCSTTVTNTASSCISTPPSRARACSSRWFSGSAAIAVSASSTRRCGRPRTAPAGTRPHQA
jgi:4-hydroxyphenylpyruvate dioxygenase